MTIWTYGRSSDRLSETYQYLTNGVGGNTPILDLVNLAVLGTRDYTWGAAGHLEEVNAAGNVIDFTSDAEGRLASTTRAVADVSASHSYDGRSFLTRAVEATGDPPTVAASVEPLYDSAGLVHALRRRPAPADPEELVVFVYLAGRPVAQLTIDGTGTETWTYLTTDHLGTPLVSTDDAGALTWESSFEPFGRDFAQDTPEGALENGIYLRLPGQWFERTWDDATSGAGLYQNVNRWYQGATGRFTRPDPLGVDGERLLTGDMTVSHLYAFARSSPVLFADPLGLLAKPPEGKWCDELPQPCPQNCAQQPMLEALTGVARWRTKFCDAARRNQDSSPVGAGSADAIGGIDGGRPWYTPQETECQDWCICAHEEEHRKQNKDPRTRQLILDGFTMHQILNHMECAAYDKSIDCLINFIQGR